MPVNKSKPTLTFDDNTAMNTGHGVLPYKVTHVKGNVVTLLAAFGTVGDALIWGTALYESLVKLQNPNRLTGVIRVY